MVSGSPALERAPGRAKGWLAESLRLETLELTLAYWATALLFSLAFWVTPFPPLIDYPQHVAIGALLHRMLDPSAPERALYDVNLITYNGGLHVAHRGALVRGAPRDRRPPAHLRVSDRLRLRGAGPRAGHRETAVVRAFGAAHHLQLCGGVGVCQLLHERALRAHHVHPLVARAPGRKRGALEGHAGEPLARLHARAGDALPLRDDRSRRARVVPDGSARPFSVGSSASASSPWRSGRRWCGR